MAIRVVCFCSYLTRIEAGWRPSDHNAHKFVQAIKRRPINGYARVPVLGRTRRLENSNAGNAADWFGDMVADHFQRSGISPPFSLVPIPNSGCTVESSRPPRTARLARAVAQSVDAGAVVVDCLRWKKALPPASKGGPRDAPTLYKNLCPVGRLDEGPYILVDDVLTGGGHVQACAAMLRKAGAKVLMGACGGRTVHDPPDDPFAVIIEELDDYNP